MPQATLSLPIHDETARNTFKHRHDTGPPEGMLARFQNHNNVPTARCEPRSGRTYPQCWKRRRCGGYWRVRRSWPQCWWAAAGPGRASRRRAEPKARGADGERAGRRPTAHTAAQPRGRTRRRPEQQRRHKQHSTGARTRRPAPLDATTQTQLRSTCVRCRSAHAARRSRRSSRSPRLRRRAGPRR